MKSIERVQPQHLAALAELTRSRLPRKNSRIHVELDPEYIVVYLKAILSGNTPARVDSLRNHVMMRVLHPDQIIQLINDNFPPKEITRIVESVLSLTEEDKYLSVAIATFLTSIHLEKNIIQKEYISYFDEAFRSKPLYRVSRFMHAFSNVQEWVWNTSDQILDAQKSPARIWKECGVSISPNYTSILLPLILDATYHNFIQRISGGYQGNENWHKFILDVLYKYILQAKLIVDEKRCKQLSKLISVSAKIPQLQKPLFEMLDDILGSPPDWSWLPHIPEKVRHDYEDLRGLVKYRYFEIMAWIIFDHDLVHGYKSNLKSRCVFWGNYRQQIRNVKMFFSEEKIDEISLNRKEYSENGYMISKNMIGEIGNTTYPSEIAFLLFKQILVIEIFRGSGLKGLIIEDGQEIFDRYFEKSMLSRLQMEELQKNTTIEINHLHYWQKALANTLEERWHIAVPDELKINTSDDNMKTTRPISRQEVKNKNQRGLLNSYSSYSELTKQVIIEK